MKILFYKPFWVYNPRAASVLDEIENEILKDNEVLLICCNGELINGCLDNPLKSKIACDSCKYFRNNDLNLLSKKIKLHSINEFVNIKEYKNKFDWNYSTVEEIKDTNYKNVDIGYAALSAYIQLTRNQSPKVTKDFKLFFDQYLITGAMVTDAITNAINSLNPDIVGVFNGRIHTRRPILRVCQQKNIKCNVYEHTGLMGSRICKKVLFENCMPQDVDFNSKLIYRTWTDSNLPELKKEEIASDFYIKKKAGEKTDDKAFTKNQDINMKPDNWDNEKRNIVIFNSSDDEFTSLGKDWEYNFGESRLKTIEDILIHFENEKEYHFYLRIHPNLKNLKYKYINNIYELNKYENLTIIPPESKISSYLLLDLAEKVITFGSTMGIEAVYWEKPSILLGTSIYDKLGATYKPNDKEELFQFIKSNLKPKEKKAAIFYSFFRMYQGKNFEHFDPNYTKKREFYLRDRLLFSLNQNYREKMYSGIFPALRNFIKYKQHSIPKNLWIKLNKKFIPKIEE